MIGGYLVVIANCPSCGTHYKHEPPKAPVRARCGRCDALLDLTRLRPYRIAPLTAADPADASRAAQHLPIGLDHPALATTIARNVERSPDRSRPIVPFHAAPPVPDSPIVRAMRPALEAAPNPAPATADDHAPPDTWDENEPLPAIPEMATRGAFEPSVPPVTESDILNEADSGASDLGVLHASSGGMTERATTFGLWLAAGAIIGTGASWTLGGTTMAGVLAGGALGAVAGWGWLRWMSPK